VSELSDIRTALVSLLTPIPELVTVKAYEQADIATSILPAASIYLLRVGPPPHAQQQELVRFGTGDFQAEWRVNVRLAPDQPQVEVVSQQVFETMHKRIRAVLAASSGQLLSDATNTTFISLLTAGEFVVPPDPTLPFVAVFSLTTITLT